MGCRGRADPSAASLDADARLLEQIRSGDAEAGRRFVREHYPAVHRYLLYLTGQPGLAEDLTQETFVQAWQHLDTFQGRASLRTWLHCIARREFLQSLRRRKVEPAMEAMADAVASDAMAWTDAVELRAVVDRLPPEQREVVLLHYLEGYSSTEIARIVDAPVGTICYRLARAREQLRQALGEDDLRYLNEPIAPMRQWRWLPLDQMHALETRLAVGGRAKEDSTMERREFLRQAAVGAAGLMLSETEREVVDSRLTQKVTCAFKATALSDLCEQLRSDTGIQVSAGPSVADEKVTLFCEKLPLREVMRQLSRPFGYTWLRSGTPGQYRYELAQDLRSQLLEEELRNRDRNAALLALEREIERYRPYVDLSPDEALARARTATPDTKPLLEKLAQYGWGAIQIYFRLSPRDLATLRAGQSLTFSSEPRPGEQPLHSDLAHGVLQSVRQWRLIKRESGFNATKDLDDPRALPLTAYPELGAQLQLTLAQSEAGQFTLDARAGFFTPKRGIEGIDIMLGGSTGRVATGINPKVAEPQNSARSTSSAHDPVLRPRITVAPVGSCHAAAAASDAGSEVGLPGSDHRVPSTEKKATSADVLEALHHASGFPIVADYYTHLYQPEAVSVRDQRLFDGLNQLSDTMRLRWNKEANWLQFRSASYYHDRLKEVPNRLLKRWETARRQRGLLTLDDLVEIAQLSDTQLDGTDMAEGAENCFGLAEWPLVQNGLLRPHLRYLASFTPAQREEAMSPAGLAFAEMALAQQQQFIANAFFPHSEPLQSLDELVGAVLRVDYTQPGWFEWQLSVDLWFRWVSLTEPLSQGRRAPRVPFRARTREAVLQAAHRAIPQIRAEIEEVRQGQRPYPVPVDDLLPLLQDPSIVPTRLNLAILYMPGTSTKHGMRVFDPNSDLYCPTP